MRPAELDNTGDSPIVIALRHLGGVLELHADGHPASDRVRPLIGTPAIT
ncbi:MAG TPA: hypothetical protein VLS89_16900 [Candidatus Nanopelagicales bacterium]|nr:hypothetical protein [Candidatus Nanopelagicales bacterium]